MPLLAADDWLYDTLSGDATLMAILRGVHSWPVPQDAVLPYALYQEQTSKDVQGMGPVRLWTTGPWIIRAVAETMSWYGDLKTAAERIDTLLQAQSGTTEGGQVFSCVREAPFQLVEQVASRQYRHLGGIYRIMAR